MVHQHSSKKKFSIQFFNRQSHEESVQLLEKMSMLLSSGMPVVSSLDAIMQESESGAMKDNLSHILNDIISGTPIWKALDNRKLYPKNAISLIRIGEQSGQLVKNLNAVVDQIHKERQFNSKVRAALFYPVFVISLTIVIGSAISLFVLPRIATVFSSLDLELPISTKILISMGIFLSDYGLIAIPLFLLIAFTGIFFLFIFEKSKHIGVALLLRTPVIGTMIKQNEIARFGYLLGSMLDSGIIITQALTSLEYSSTVKPYKNIYSQLNTLVESGNSFKKSFELIEDINSYIPISIQQMVVAAEQSGTTAKILERIGTIYEDKAENAARNLSSALEPTLILIVGVVVFIVAVSIIFPIYNLIGNINQ